MAPRRVARRTLRFLRRSFRLKDKTFLTHERRACKLARGIPCALSRHPIDAHSAVSSIGIAFHPRMRFAPPREERVFRGIGTLMDRILWLRTDPFCLKGIEIGL